MNVDALPKARSAAAGQLLSLSHADYPVFRHFFPNPEIRSCVLRHLMAAAARDAAEHAGPLMATAEGEMLGVALWMPPGTFPLSVRRKAGMAPGLIRAAMAHPRAMAALGKAGAALETAHDPRPSWYLQALGVRPDAQGTGVGRRLIEPVLHLADRDNLPCHLHTSDPANIAYYQRFDFEVQQDAEVAVADGVSYTGMSRAPRRAAGP